jgi:NTP pyrophosphatase (non-canonical NTP hydrolase)
MFIFHAISFHIKTLTLHKSKDDILIYLSEFEAIAKQAKWTNEIKVLQLRTLLTGEAKEVSQLANKNYEELTL